MNLFNIKTIIIIIAVIAFFELRKDTDTFQAENILPKDTKILAFGDSITQGYRLKNEESYPAQLAKLLEVEVINAGISGEMSAQGLKRLPSTLDKYKPKILILCHGGNDILRKRNFEELKSNIEKMIKLAKQRDIHVILVGVPQFEIISLNTVPLYYELATTLDIPLEDEALEEILDESKLKIDQIHPNAKGYEILANKLAILITDTYLAPNPF